MRDIKFRAWDKSYKIMNDDFYIHSENGIYDDNCRHYDTPNIEIAKCNDDLEIMQYTGLHDKNGKGIYEGDIVKSTKNKYKRFDENGIYEVYFNDFLCHYALIASRNEWETKHGQYDNYSLTECKAKEFEVIGNIYENAELLESEDKNV